MSLHPFVRCCGRCGSELPSLVQLAGTAAAGLMAHGDPLAALRRISLTLHCHAELCGPWTPAHTQQTCTRGA